MWTKTEAKNGFVYIRTGSSPRPIKLTVEEAEKLMNQVHDTLDELKSQQAEKVDESR